MNKETLVEAPGVHISVKECAQDGDLGKRLDVRAACIVDAGSVDDYIQCAAQ